MSAGLLYFTSLVARICLGGISVVILSCAVSSGIVTAVLIFDINAGFRMLRSSLQGTNLLRYDRLASTPTLDLSQDILFVGEQHPEAVKMIAGLLFLVSLLFTCLAVVGCYGTVARSVFCTDSFSFICGLLLSLASGSLYVMLMYPELVGGRLRERIRDYLQRSYSPTPDDPHMVGSIVDFIQARFGCCGVSNFTDFHPNFPPLSCCRLKTIDGLRDEDGRSVFVRMFEDCPRVMTLRNSNIATGCFDILWAFVESVSCEIVIDFWFLLMLGLFCGILLRKSGRIERNQIVDSAENVI